MSNSRLVVPIFLILQISLAGLYFSANGQAEASSPRQKTEAENAWAGLIREKGGSERLHSLTNVLIENPDYAEVRLYVFPDMRWHLGRLLDGSRSLDVYNGGVKTWYLTDGFSSAGHEDRTRFMMEEQLPFMLETKFYKPELLRVMRMDVEKKKMDVIETMVGDIQMDFVYEPEEMLVREVWFHGHDGRVLEKYRFWEYVEIDGLKMPRAWSFDQAFNKYAFLKLKHPISFQFNVDYDPKIFEPPFDATTPDAWRRKP